MILHRVPRLLTLVLSCALILPMRAQKPPEPVDPSPIDGETYYIINQLSALQIDLSSGSASDKVILQNRSFTSLTQRWAFTHLQGDDWAISNLASGLCLDKVQRDNVIWTIQTTCALSKRSQHWSLSATNNGYLVILNRSTGAVLDVSSHSPATGARLVQTPISTKPTQSQQWLLRPAFFRGIDNALLEKQETNRLLTRAPWWQDAGKSQDILQMLKNHGINMVRVRPTSVPPYRTYKLSDSKVIPSTCTPIGCYTETESADLDLAKRAKQLGMSLELTLFFDGKSSEAGPDEWSTFTLKQAESAVYNYVKFELEAYRKAGVMPDMVTIGNEVDTGFFGKLASPSGNNFAPFAALQRQAMQAVSDAAADPALGPAIPPPLRCIHVTPAWDLTDFFEYANRNAIPYDAVCQSYYPIFHGPLTVAQAAAANPKSQPVEQSALIKVANTLGKPIFLIEVGEHYESGFESNAPWYPATIAGQRQFLIDVNSVMKNLPNNLGMGIEYWDPEGVNIRRLEGGYSNGDGEPDAIYAWNGMTLFDNADSSGTSQPSMPNYSAILPGVDALGGKLDANLSYKLLNLANGLLLEVVASPTASGAPLSLGATDGSATLKQQWRVVSNAEGTLQLASRNESSGSTVVLDAVQPFEARLSPAVSGTPPQKWDIITAANGNYTVVSKSTGLVLAATPSGVVELQPPAQTQLDWITPRDNTQLWKLIPIHITKAVTR